MPFENPITGGQGALVRPAIKSPNYAAGTTGWTVNQDGTAEFNNVTVRGTVAVRGSNGTEVDITTNAAVAEIVFVPPTVGGVTWDNASIDAQEDQTADHRPSIVVASPDVNLGGSQSFSEVWVTGSGVTTADSEVRLRAGRIRLDDNKLSAITDLMLNNVSLGRGYQFTSARNTNITVGAITMVNDSVANFVWRAGRVYKVSLYGRMGTNTAGNLAIFKLLRGSSTASSVAIDFGGFKCGAVGDLLPVNISALIANNTANDITQTVQPSLQSSAGTVTWDGGTMPRSWTLEDIGSASAFTNGGNAFNTI
jgi:hypothetical protein